MADLIGPNDVVIGNQKWTFAGERMKTIRQILTEGDVDPVAFEFSGPQLGEAAACNVLAVAGYEIKSPRQISDAKDAAENPPQVSAQEAQTRDTELRDLMSDNQKMKDLIFDLKRELADLKAKAGRPANRPDDYGPGESPFEKLQTALGELGAAELTIRRLKDEVANLKRERGLEA